VGEKKLPPGRPPKLDGELAIQIAARLLAGLTTSDVAQELGVSRRSIAGWRARAWSRDPRDSACVELERALWRGRAAQAGADQRPAIVPLVPIADVYAELDDDADWP
jgi:hypothetical protein